MTWDHSVTHPKIGPPCRNRTYPAEWRRIYSAPRVLNGIMRECVLFVNRVELPRNRFVSNTPTISNPLLLRSASLPTNVEPILVTVMADVE